VGAVVLPTPKLAVVLTRFYLVAPAPPPAPCLLRLQTSDDCLELKTAMLEFLSNVYLDTDDPIDGTELEVGTDLVLAACACSLPRLADTVFLELFPCRCSVPPVEHDGLPRHPASSRL
jgi:hypothetical protein